MDYMKKYSKLLSCLLNWEEMEEIKRRGRLSDQTIEAFLKELHLYKICDWAETNCLSDFLSFIEERSFALNISIMYDELSSILDKLILNHQFSYKGEYMEFVLSKCSKELMKSGLRLVTLDSGEDYYKIFVINKQNTRRLKSINSEYWHFVYW